MTRGIARAAWTDFYRDTSGNGCWLIDGEVRRVIEVVMCADYSFRSRRRGLSKGGLLLWL